MAVRGALQPGRGPRMSRLRHAATPVRLGPRELRLLADIALLRRAASRMVELHLTAFAAALAYGA